MAPSEDSGYLSDESSFYGDSPTKADLEARTTSFSPTSYWSHPLLAISPTALANAGRESQVQAEKPAKAIKLYNPYEGDLSGRQLGESVDDFLERLPPRDTVVTERRPWILIANPYSRVGNERQGRANGPEEEEGDWAEFVRRGGALLEELTSRRIKLEQKMPGKAKSSVTRAFNQQGHKRAIEKEILDAAVELKCTSGKWMLFCDPSEINDVWAVVAQATAKNELGTSAKVAPNDGSETGRADRIICVYTKNFRDIEDVARVAQKMRELGLIDARDKGIYYKCDAYTYLDLKSSNVWGIKASLYSSTEVLAAATDKKKLDGLALRSKEGA